MRGCSEAEPGEGKEDSHIKRTGDSSEIVIGKDPVLWVWLEIPILKLYIKLSLFL